MPNRSASGSWVSSSLACSSNVIGNSTIAAMAAEATDRSTRSAVPGDGGVGVEVVLGDGVLDDRLVDGAVGGERGEDGHHHVGGVGLEVGTQGLAGVRATEAVGAE